MNPLRFNPRYFSILLLINLSLPGLAQGQNWWEKSRGGWQDEPKAADGQAETSTEGSLSDAEETVEAPPKAQPESGTSDYDQEIARRKSAAAKARAAVKQASPEDDLQSLESNSQAKVESETLPVKTKVVEPVQSAQEIPKETVKEAPKKAKRVARKRRSREVASLESSEDSLDAGSSATKVRTRRRKQESPDLFRIGVLSGIASVSGTSGSSGGSLLNLGMQADYQSKFWGAELDGYYGMGLGLSASGSGASGMTQSQYGLFIGPKFNYTFGSGDFRFTPKAGVGYGMLSISYSATDASTGTTSQSSGKSSFSGIYAMAGFDMYFTRWLYLNTDYSMSVSASGTVQATLNGNSVSGNVDGASFQRIRAGLNFVIMQRLILGAQYYSRSISVQGVSAPQNFVLGHLGLQF